MRNTLADFRSRSTGRALMIFLGTFVPFIVLWALSFHLAPLSILYVIALATPLHVLHARLFVIMHDCGHHAFSDNRQMNDLIGHAIGLFFTLPFFAWRELHNRHHQYQGNLDMRGKSLDVWTLTKREYEMASPLTRLAYRLYRSPFVLIGIAPFVFFLFVFRVPFERFARKTHMNIHILNLALLAIGAAFWKSGALEKFLLVQFSYMSLSFFLASWLFYVQHQLEETIWFKADAFDQIQVSLQGSSYYLLPGFLRWMTGDIAYHHIHHLDPLIPMYNLARAHEKLSETTWVKPIGLKESVGSFKFKLWDEERNRMVPFQ